MTPFDQQRKYLELFRQGPGYLAYKPVCESFTQKWFANTDEALEIIDQQYASSDIWVSMGTFPNRRLTRDADNATGLFSLRLDVDAHKNSRYKSPEEAEAASLKFVRTLGLPEPTAMGAGTLLR